MKAVGKILFYVKALAFMIRGKEKRLSVSIPSVSEMLKGKTILVTGGSSGYGYSMAEQLIRQGARVIIVGRDNERLAIASKKLGNDSAMPLQWDVADLDCVDEKIAEADKLSGGSIDAFVNNAGVTIIGTTHFIESDWDKIFGVNTYAIEVLNNAQYRYLKSKGGGKIINITSNANIISEFHPYYVSKSDALGITLKMAENSLRDNISVNSIAPGIAITNINPALKAKIGNSGNYYCSATLNKRYTLVEDVANLALFLISDKGNGINGQNIVVDGGMSLI